LSFLACSCVSAQTSGQGLTGQYFLDDGSGTHLQGTPVTVGVDPTLNFDFNARPPSNIPSAANFSARWTGKIRPRFTERYLLSTFSDDGVRVLINGQAVIDNYTYHPPTWNSGSIDLLGNQDYDIEVDYFQGMWDAKLQLWWQSASQGNEIVPQSQLYAAASTSSQGVANGQGLTAEYFAADASGAHLQGTPTTTEIATTINFDFIARPPSSVPSGTNFSARFTGKIRPRFSEAYVFSTFSDDGVRVKIGGQTVIDNFTYHPPTWDSNSIVLQAGRDYDMEVDFPRRGIRLPSTLVGESESAEGDCSAVATLPCAGGQRSSKLLCEPDRKRLQLGPVRGSSMGKHPAGQ
jgi:hypothetical protein